MKHGIEIVIRGLEKRFEGGLVCALDGVDLSIGPGKRVAITGPTGCGKSTLLSIVALLEKPDAGELYLGGRASETINPPESWRAQHLGMIFQLHHLLPHLTVEENVMLPLFGRKLRVSAIRTRTREILELIGIGHRGNFVISKLSGGERQLTAGARALVTKPSLVLADEPTGSVDSDTGERVLDLIMGDAMRPGPTVVLVTHDERVAARADRTISMLDGRIHG